MTDLSVDNYRVGPDTRITLYFSLTLEDGAVIDSNFEGEPANFVYGDGSLLPGFEAVLEGLEPGEQGAFEITPEHGFGQHNSSNVQQIPRREFADDIELEVGLMLSFADANRAELPGVIVALDDDTVSVDFNHPLAGRTITFKVHIIDVVPAITH
ncbi:MAG: peptidylprolyl isomerase [Porticoccaceae bacterium]|nr:peptidylprolyl isomerase [Pseudomonadales bacterium]MCP5172512.1 peptidylprolyl isomerase [Pseudomonadales bacterium]